VKSNEIVNRLNRTKREESPNLEARREAYDAEVRPPPIIILAMMPGKTLAACKLYPTVKSCR